MIIADPAILAVADVPLAEVVLVERPMCAVGAEPARRALVVRQREAVVCAHHAGDGTVQGFLADVPLVDLDGLAAIQAVKRAGQGRGADLAAIA